MLRHDAGSGNITADFDFTIKGNLGTATITGTAVENLTLQQFADRVNAQSHKTGVVASVDGQLANHVKFDSVEYGTRAVIEITPGAEPFATIGGNGDSTANGTNAAATINGFARSGDLPDRYSVLIHSTAAGTRVASRSRAAVIVRPSW